MLSRNSKYAGMDAIFTMVSLFIVYRMVNTHAGVGSLGEWSLASALATLCGFADLGVTDAMVRQVPQRRRDFNGAGLAGLVLVCLCCTVVLVGLACLIMEPLIREAVRALLGPPAPGMVEGAVLVAFVNVLASGALGTLEGFERYGRRLLAGMLASTAAVLAALLILPAHGAAGLPVVLVTRAVILVVAAGAFVGVSVGRAGFGRSRDMIGELRLLVSLGLPLRITGLANLAFDPLTRVFLAKFGGAQAIGIYEIAARITTQIRGVAVGAVQVIVPRLVMLAGTPEVGAKLLREMVGVLSLIAATTFTLLILVLPIISLVLLRRIDDMFMVFGALLSLAWCANVLAAPAYFSNVADARPGRNVVSQLTIAVLNLALGHWLGSHFGATGVVLGTALSLAGGSIVTILAARVPRPLVSVATDPGLWLSGLVALALCWSCLFAFSDEIVRAATSVALAGVFAAIAWFRGAPFVKQGLKRVANAHEQ